MRIGGFRLVLAGVMAMFVAGQLYAADGVGSLGGMPGDVAARLFVEQWVTFPRYLVTGGFARAWSAAQK